MTLKQSAMTLAVIAALGMASCASQEKKDAEAKAKIEALAPGVTVSVKDGVATLSGEMASEAQKEAAIHTAKGVENIKSVVDNTSVVMAPATPAPAPVVINPDETLTTATLNVLEKFPGVTASVKEGVITLSGSIKKADWMALKPMLDALRPKKVENKMTIN